MIKILHLSDLHFYKKDERTNNMQEILIQEAEDAFKDVPKKQKILIITGDFHNYNDEQYDMAEQFLNKLINAMDLEKAEDVFVVPGNHDVGNDIILKACDVDPQNVEAYTNMLKDGHMKYVEKKLSAYRPYCNFVRRMGFYPNSDEYLLPASVHVRQWRGKLNILHLNTTLIADGLSKDNQIVDVAKATDSETWKDYLQSDLPAVALGHNHFYDLTEENQTALQTAFKSKNISAYLCGDTHLVEIKPEKQMIALESQTVQGRLEIPVFVCAKGIAEKNDKYSDFGYYLHEWDEDTGCVNVVFQRWKPHNLAQTFQDESARGKYSMRPFPPARPSVGNTMEKPSKKGGIGEYLKKVSISSFNLTANDYEKENRIIIWPVIPRKMVNAIHLAQLELIRILSKECHWSVQCLITELSLHHENMKDDDVKTFIEEIEAFCKNKKIDIDFISLNCSNTIKYINTTNEIPLDKEKFNENVFNVFDCISLEELKSINEKNYDDSAKEEISKRTLLSYVLPLFQLAAIRTLTDMTKTKKTKYIIVAGKDEETQWRDFVTTTGKTYLSALFIPELSTEDGNTLYQPGEDNKNKNNKSAINCYSEDAVKAFANTGNVSQWYYWMFYCLPTQREVKKRKKKNTEMEWCEIFEYIRSIIQTMES